MNSGFGLAQCYTCNGDIVIWLERGEVIAYHIRFKPCDKSTYDEMTVDVGTTSILLTRSLGLKASTMHSFEVRALNAEHAATEWTMISAFIGM